jgi:hypothetical protein
MTACDRGTDCAKGGRHVTANARNTARNGRRRIMELPPATRRKGTAQPMTKKHSGNVYEHFVVDDDEYRPEDNKPEAEPKMTEVQLEALRGAIQRYEEYEKKEREALIGATWKFTVTAVSHRAHDTLNVQLTSLGAGTVDFPVPRLAQDSPYLKIGAVWTLYPGFAEPSYREKLQLARRMLLHHGGDIDKLSEEHREILIDSDSPF